MLISLLKYILVRLLLKIRVSLISPRLTRIDYLAILSQSLKATASSPPQSGGWAYQWRTMRAATDGGFARSVIASIASRPTPGTPAKEALIS